MNRADWLLKILRDRLHDERHRDPSNPGPASSVYHNETRNDQWIAESIFPGKRDGYFVEAGAGNGIEGSSCYLLEKALGWTGICVEPNDGFFEDLVRNRPRSICERVCLAGHAGRVEYIEGADGVVSPYLGGIKANLETVKSGGKDVVRKGTPVAKDAITLVELLERHSAPSLIDYAAFDIEGSEWEVLENFSFERYTFLALSLECDGAIWAPVSRLLSSHGYREVSNPFNRYQPWERYWLHERVAGTGNLA